MSGPCCPSGPSPAGQSAPTSLGLYYLSHSATLPLPLAGRNQDQRCGAIVMRLAEGRALEPEGFELSADPKARRAALEQSPFPTVFPEKHCPPEGFHPPPQGCPKGAGVSPTVIAPERHSTAARDPHCPELSWGGWAQPASLGSRDLWKELPEPERPRPRFCPAL